MNGLFHLFKFPASSLNINNLEVMQKPLKSWHKIMGESTISDAICDRMIHSTYRIEPKEESARKKYAGKIDIKLLLFV